jgi:hypothetical protein
MAISLLNVFKYPFLCGFVVLGKNNIPSPSDRIVVFVDFFPFEAKTFIFHNFLLGVFAPLIPFRKKEKELRLESQPVVI